MAATALRTRIKNPPRHTAMAGADVRWLQRLDNYGRALDALQRAVDTAQQRPVSELEEQGLIQSFEFTHELSWLLLKDFLADQGVSGVSGSRDAVREATLQELQSTMQRRALQR
jgi:hypothetical protein